jgi:hypothetical protein
LEIGVTRGTQKETERRTLEAVLAALGITPDGPPEDGEAPDFVLPLASRRIGVEVTTYSSGAVVEGGAELRKVENEWELLKQASTRFRAASPEFREVNVLLIFNGPVPPKRQHQALIDEIASFVSEHRDASTWESVAFWWHDFTAPLMRGYLRTLYLRNDRNAEWSSNVSAGFIARPDHMIAAIVAKKSGLVEKSAKTGAVDELWLAILGGTRISEMISDIEGVEDFAAVPDLQGFVFDRCSCWRSPGSRSVGRSFSHGGNRFAARSFAPGNRSVARSFSRGSNARLAGRNVGRNAAARTALARANVGRNAATRTALARGNAAFAGPWRRRPAGPGNAPRAICGHRNQFQCWPVRPLLVLSYLKLNA